MTDFIHEHPKDAQPAVPTPPPAAAAEPEMDERTGQKRVYGYIFILFVVAFSLLLWAFLMNQRSTDEVLSELRGNADALQTTLDRNVTLEKQNEVLEKQIDELAKENEELQGRLSEHEKADEENRMHREEENAALTVYRAAALAGEERYEEAAEELTAWTGAELADCLDRYDASARRDAGGDGQSDPARARYDALVAQLPELGYLAVGEDGRLHGLPQQKTDA